MDVTFLIGAFVLGFAASAIRLPPLVGYLAAGFLFHELGYESTPGIELVAEIGVLLLLFSIGLKLKIRNLARPEVFAGASIHMVLSTGLIGSFFLLLGVLEMPLPGELSVSQAALLGFAFSFSSTVYAVKALEDRDETSSLAGRVAIGILIVQDLFAVGYLALSGAELPSIWALPVVVLVLLLRPVWGWLLDRSGHGELLVLFGLVLALGVGAASFELVGLKPDIGALLVGLTLAGHSRASELASRLLSFKDILLIGFFLSIGLGGVPGPGALLVALAALLLVPLKAAGFVAVITRFRLRSRTAWHSSISLATFSEFGLIVIVAGVNGGRLDGDWAAVMAIVVAASFALAAPVNARRYNLYQRFAPSLERLQRSRLNTEDSLIEVEDVRVLVFGLGRIGTGAYDELIAREGAVVLGVDRSDRTVEANRSLGRDAIRGDALDSEFWERVQLHPGVELVILAMSDHRAQLEAAGRIRQYLPEVKIAAAAQYPDEVAQLVAAGVDVARNLFSEAGRGLADDACDLLLSE